uniref:Uncharacterized protein n=1 Tax=Cacopsylla melanoneura TaxID=428564 RepID=A0A8D8RD83_9HEMI
MCKLLCIVPAIALLSCFILLVVWHCELSIYSGILFSFLDFEFQDSEKYFASRPNQTCLFYNVFAVLRSQVPNNCFENNCSSILNFILNFILCVSMEYLGTLSFLKPVLAGSKPAC